MKVQVHSSTNPILKLALDEIARQVRDPYDFVILAVSPIYPYEDVAESIPAVLEIEKERYFAFNAVDSFCNTEIVENGIVACFIKFERKGSIQTFIKGKITDYEFSELVSKTADYISNNLSLFHIIIADFVHGYFPLFLEKLSAELEKRKIPADRICGAINSTFTKNGRRDTGYLFSGHNFIEDGVAILSLKNVLSAVSISTGTFKRGPIYTITSGKDFKIYELDGKPAARLPKRLLQNLSERKLEYLWYTPLVIIDDRGNSHAVRTFKRFTDEYIEVWAPIKEGQRVKLAFVVPEDILKDTERTARKLKNAIKTADLCLDFSCTARQYTLGNRANEEIRTYGRVINAPLFGFFTNGEVASNVNSIRKNLEMHNQTSTAVVLREI